MHESPERGQIVGGKYRVVRPLGRGGMAIVFEAENIATGKRVALKWLHSEVSTDVRAGERLLREAQLAARVRHPNVIDIYDADRHGDDLFLVMEYLEGESLRALLERGGTPPAELLTLLIGAMRGVAAAHQEGVIHRDIKPENIFLVRRREDGALTAKVLDFGISATLDAHPARLITAAMTFGTPIYMSYEQLAGEHDVDARTDVYSFGVILYEALSGQVPFDADSYPGLLTKLASAKPVRLRKHRPDLSYALERVVLSALQRDRARRPVSVDAMVAALEPCVADLTSRAVPPAAATSPMRLPRGTAQLSASLRTLMLVNIVQRELHRRSTEVLVAVGLVGLGAAMILHWGGAHPTALGTQLAARDKAQSAQSTLDDAAKSGARPRHGSPRSDAGMTSSSAMANDAAASATIVQTSTHKPAWPNRRARAHGAVTSSPATPSWDAGRVRHRIQTPRPEEF
jgi:serine/threonine protein kinase